MEVLDRKFKIRAVSIKSGKVYTEKNSILFLAKDAILLDVLDNYYHLLSERLAGERQLKGVRLLKDRTLKWQRKNIKKVKLADVDEGKEEKRVCKENRKAA